MQIKLTKPLLNSHYNDNGTNTFKDIDIIYIHNININLVIKYYHFFRSAFIKASMNFVSNNPKQNDTTADAEAKIEATQIAMVLFDGNQEIIDKSNELLLKVCFKDEALKNKLTLADLNELDYDDWEALISNFLHSFWLNRWLTGAKKK
jgi:hypothetical protein